MRVRSVFREIGREMENAVPLWVCHDCLADYMLKMMSTDAKEARVCSACGKTKINVLKPERIASFIKKRLPEHFQLDFELYPGYEMTLDNVVGRTIGCSSEIVQRAISVCLEDPNAGEKDFYWPGQEYCRQPSPFESEDHERWYALGNWHVIANELAHGQRFFNDTARSLFEWLIEEALDAKDPERDGAPALVTTLEAGTTFYRSRVASSKFEAESFAGDAAIQLGVAPKERAANNRMSPAGVPLLYVSREIDTCIAEVRPSIGDIVVVGEFLSTAPLKFFDFTLLNRQLHHAPLSILDPSYQERSDCRLMLQYLHEEIARPVRAFETDYVMTQALAEFIRYDKKWLFDGIAFQSVQYKGGVNYVLFDRGTLEAMIAPKWRPTFHLTISADAVSFYEIEGVGYINKPISIPLCKLSEDSEL